jgi:hypothetical protein
MTDVSFLFSRVDGQVETAECVARNGLSTVAMIRNLPSATNREVSDPDSAAGAHGSALLM